jgi:hypothetical protein
MEVIPTPTAAFFALDVEHVELADQVSENDGTFTRHDSAAQFLHDSGAAAMSEAAWILLPRPLALLSCVHRRTSPRLLALPTVVRSDRIATA